MTVKTTKKAMRAAQIKELVNTIKVAEDAMAKATTISEGLGWDYADWCRTKHRMLAFERNFLMVRRVRK